MDYDRALELFEPVLGFEVHVELNTQSKMFSDAPNPAALGNVPHEPNTTITPVDLGLPGSLPVVNEQAIKYSISLGLALGCEIAPSSRFARKNYFYPDLLPVEPSLELIEELRAALPEAPSLRKKRLQGEWGFTDLEFQDVVNSGLLVEIDETVAAGAAPAQARKWWTGEVARLANVSSVDASSLVSPADVAALVALVDAGELTDRLARQVLEGVIAGEGSPAQVVESRGLKVVSDDGALIAAIDEALAAQPDVLEKIREGKVQAAGAVIGAVMKAMKGTADAARVRELVLERAQQ